MQRALSPAGSGSRFAQLREILLLSVIALLPIDSDITIWEASAGAAGSFHLRVGLSAFHFPLGALLVVSLVDAIVYRRRPRGALGTTLMMGALWLVVCFAVTPTWRGVDTLVHLLAGWAIVDTVRQGAEPIRRRLVVALCVLGGMEAALAVAQRILGRPVGIDLIEAPGSLAAFGPVASARGTLDHQYHFVAVMLICTSAVLVALSRQPTRPVTRLLCLELVLLGLAVPMTYSRAAVLAVVPMLIFIGVRLRRRLLAPAGCWVLGLMMGVVVSLEGLAGRATASVDEGSAFDNGRIQRLREAMDLLQENPIFGTGPGNYVIELRKMSEAASGAARNLLPSHNVVAHYAAEAGLIGGLLTLAVLGFGAAWAIKSGRLTVLVAMALPAFLVLDLFPYARQIGVVWTALWIALMQVAAVEDAYEEVQRQRGSSTTSGLTA